MINIFNEILYRPLFNALVFLYQIIPGNDFGLAIIILTVLIRLMLLPLSLATARSQRAMQEIQPRIQELREKFKNDKAAQSAAIMGAYREHHVNPLAGCLPLIIQIPVIIALYKAFLAGFRAENLDLIYSFIHRPDAISALFMGTIQIASPSHILAILAGAAQFFQARMTMTSQSAAAQPEVTAALNKQMMYFFPFMIIIIGWSLPAGLMLYWITTAVFSVGEQIYIRRAT